MQDKRTPFLREGFEASETNVNSVLAKISYDGLAEAMTDKGTMLEGGNYEPSVELFQNLETNATLKLIAAIQKQRAHQRN